MAGLSSTGKGAGGEGNYQMLLPVRSSALRSCGSLYQLKSGSCRPHKSEQILPIRSGLNAALVFARLSPTTALLPFSSPSLLTSTPSSLLFSSYFPGYGTH